MVWGVRESAHFSGRDIEQVLEALCPVSDTPPESALFVGDKYAQAGGHAGKMHGNHGAGEAGANDCDIENGGVFSHGLLKMRTGAGMDE
jgi:hypothetical protein